jgi:hypothetical protein
MQEHDYVQMPQNDLAQIDQIAKEYSTGEAKGLTHGVQKDAIQNGFGARENKKEVEACKTWVMRFRLLKINGADALVFWDEGTVGLTGDILTDTEIIERFGTDKLGPDQRLSRFLSRFVSGDNLGAGSFGRGKLVFHAASQTKSILVDSLRADDKKYVALDRKIHSGILKQPNKPFEGDKAKEFVIQQTKGAVVPLTVPGTRITIFDVHPEITTAFNLSFTNPSTSSYKASFAHMIEETWWEIIHKFDAKIYLHLDGQELLIELHGPLLEIIEAEDGQNGVRVHKKENVSITAGNQQYKIKEIKMVVMPGTLDEEYRDIWVQRKRMKIGSIARNITPHHKIMNKFATYVILEPELEDLIENAEGVTHYDFDIRGSGIRQIRQRIKSELNEFEKKLGLAPINEDAETRRQLIDSLKEINDIAQALGLLTQNDLGANRTDLDILLKDIILPQADSLRVEIGDEVGPITYQVKSKSSTPMFGTFCVIGKQKGRDITPILSKKLDFASEETIEVTVDAFRITKNLFENGKPFQIEAFYRKDNSNEILSTCLRTIFIGCNPPVSEKPAVNLSATCKFPRRETRRVEMTDVITDIKIKATNTTPYNLYIDLAYSVRHLENPKSGRMTLPLSTLFEKKDFLLKPQQDIIFYIDDLSITPEIFGTVQQTPVAVAERTCDLFTTVRLSRASIELNKPKKYRINKVSNRFYLEVDPPGFSIFNDVLTAEAPADNRQSWHEGDMETGYRFLLNSGHGAYKFLEKREDPYIMKCYAQEQMLRQAYLIAFENDVFRGSAEQYKEKLTDSSTPYEIASTFDELIGCALNEMRS